MPISVACPVCEVRLKAPDAAAGQTLTCPSCKAPVDVPRPKAPPTAVGKTTELPPPAPAEEEVFEDFEIVEDAPLEELPGEEDEALEEVEEPLDELEEVSPPRRREQLAWSRLLGMELIFVRGQHSDLAEVIAHQERVGYDLIDPRSGRGVGEAREVQDTQEAVLRVFVGRNLVPTRIEIRELPERAMVGIVRRPAYVWGSSLEVLDLRGEILGTFERTPWHMLIQTPVWITTPSGRKLLRIHPQASRGRCVFLTPDGREVGEMVTESAWEGRLKVSWFRRGGSYYVRFYPREDLTPRERLLFLGAALGMDLYFEEGMKR
jgi:hypothetical protein